MRVMESPTKQIINTLARKREVGDLGRNTVSLKNKIFNYYQNRILKLYLENAVGMTRSTFNDHLDSISR